MLLGNKSLQCPTEAQFRNYSHLKTRLRLGLIGEVKFYKTNRHLRHNRRERKRDRKHPTLILDLLQKSSLGYYGDWTKAIANGYS
jgi:hypothetical protein